MTVKVKPLEWEHLGHDNWRAFSPLFGSVRVDNYGHGCTVNWSVPGYTNEFIPGKWDASDDAKAAAQAEYERRILSVILSPEAPASSKEEGE